MTVSMLLSFLQLELTKSSTNQHAIEQPSTPSDFSSSRFGLQGELIVLMEHDVAHDTTVSSNNVTIDDCFLRGRHGLQRQ